MNNFEIDEQAKQLMDGHSAYALARRVIELEDKLAKMRTDENKLLPYRTTAGDSTWW